MNCESCHHYHYPKNPDPPSGTGELGWLICGEGNIIHRKTMACSEHREKAEKPVKNHLVRNSMIGAPYTKIIAAKEGKNKMTAKKQPAMATASSDSGTQAHVRTRRKQYQLPDSGRIAVTLDKRQLKEFKKIGVEFEMSDNEVLQFAVEVMIHKFHRLTTRELDERGKAAMFDGDCDSSE